MRTRGVHFINNLYLNENFEDGKIVDNVQNIFSRAKVRFDVFNQTFELYEEVSNPLTLKKSENVDIIVEGEKFVLTTMPTKYKDNILDKKYLVELTTSTNYDVILYKEYDAIVKPGRKAKNHYLNDIAPKVKIDVNFYIKNNNNLTKLNLSKFDVLDKLQDNQELLKQYLNLKNFKFNGTKKHVEAQLIQTVRYYNSL
jgi:hypothetical protein